MAQKHAILAPFDTQNRTFTKTGSGQTQAKLRQTGHLLSAGCNSSNCSASPVVSGLSNEFVTAMVKGGTWTTPKQLSVILH